MTERRIESLLRRFVELVMWQVEAHEIGAEDAVRALMNEGVQERRAQRLVVDALNRRPSCFSPR